MGAEGSKRQLPDKAMIGMVHVRALPGTPKNTLPLSKIIEKAVEEARILIEEGFDAIEIENMHDTPYLLRKVGPEIVAGMTAVGVAIRREFPNVILGVQVLAGANEEALAVAQACGASFIRAEGFVFSHVADEGIMAEASAGKLLRYRKYIGAEDVKVMADVKKKHSAHAITADVSIGETAKAAEFFGADAVIVTGVATAMPVNPAEVAEVKRAVKIPVVIGSGVDPNNIRDLWNISDAFIVGSYIKKDGHWAQELDVERIKTLINVVKQLRKCPPPA